MEAAKALLPGLCSNSTIPSFQAPKPNSVSSSLSSFSCYYSNVKPHNFPSFKTHLPHRLFDKTLQCVNSTANEGCKWAEPQNIKRKKKLAVFVSGGGSNFKSIHQACVRGSVHGDIVLLVTNKNGCGGAEYARNKEIPVILFPRTKDEPNGLSSSDLVTIIRKFKVDFILLAGYLKLIPAELVQAYPQRILNIHPSLLPAFGGKGYFGMKVHKAVIGSGARYSGPTIHFVDEHYDTGRILAQKVVPVLANDTAEELAARVLQEEHRLYVEVAEALCEERIRWREDGVPLIQSRDNPEEYC